MGLLEERTMNFWKRLRLDAKWDERWALFRGRKVMQKHTKNRRFREPYPMLSPLSCARVWSIVSQHRSTVTLPGFYCFAEGLSACKNQPKPVLKSGFVVASQ